MLQTAYQQRTCRIDEKILLVVIGLAFRTLQVFLKGKKNRICTYINPSELLLTIVFMYVCILLILPFAKHEADNLFCKKSIKPTNERHSTIGAVV